MNLSDYKLGSPTPILIKGEPGTGKTVAAASFPNPRIFSVDAKVGAIKKYYSYICPNDEILDSVDYRIVRDVYKDLLEPLEQLQDNCNCTPIVDTLTATSFKSVEYSMKYRPNRETSLKRGQIVLSEIEDYNVESRVLTSVISMLKYISSTFNVFSILIAHVLETEQQVGRSKVISRTLITGAKKLAAWIPGEFDEIYQLDCEPAINVDGEPQYVCKTVGDGTDFARTSLPVPNKINWTKKIFYKTLMESFNENI